MLTARSLADILGARLGGDDSQWDVPLTAPAPLDQAGAGQLTFLSSNKYRRQLGDCRATAILLTAKAVDQAPAGAALLEVEEPYRAYALASHHFSREPQPRPGVHASAVVADDVVLGEGVSIGPRAVVESGCQLGDGCVIGPGSVLGEGVIVGPRTRLFANVTLYYGVRIGADCRLHAGAVIGSDGFGYAPAPPGWEKIAQLGTVVLGDRVEIGANSTIDRGAIADTRIGDDVIVDNLVQLGHNVVLGQGVALAGQAGVAGSTEIGAGCTIGGQSAVNGHMQIPAGVHFTGRSMVTYAPSEPGLYSSGWSLQSNRDWHRTTKRLFQLEKLEERLKKLEAQLAQTNPKEDSE